MSSSLVRHLVVKQYRLTANKPTNTPRLVDFSTFSLFLLLAYAVRAWNTKFYVRLVFNVPLALCSLSKLFNGGRSHAFYVVCNTETGIVYCDDHIGICQEITWDLKIKTVYCWKWILMKIFDLRFWMEFE